MSRNKGTFIFASNYQVTTAEALDPRMTVDTKAELYSEDTWPSEDGSVYLYNGLLVSVLSEKNVYMLIDRFNYKQESAWKLISGGSSTSTGGGLSDSDREKLDSIQSGATHNVEKALKIGNKIYDGSVETEITASDLGLSSALKYCGVTSTYLSDKSTISKIMINGKEFNAEVGSVVIYADREFIWSGSQWNELGYININGSNISLEIVNDLTTGGANKALSAEMGKTLQDTIIENEEILSYALNTLNDTKQDVLVSGTNIKTINGKSILGSGNMNIVGTGGGDSTYLPENLPLSLATEETIGGIPSGTTVRDLMNKTFTDMFNDLLFPTRNPEHTNPDIVGIDFSEETVSVGSNTLSITNLTFEQGNWTKYNNDLNYAGSATEVLYDIKINGNTYNSLDNLPVKYTTPGQNTYSVTIKYNQGPTPVNNKGVEQPSLAAPSSSITRTKIVNTTYEYSVRLTTSQNGMTTFVTPFIKDGNKGVINFGNIGTIPSDSIKDSIAIFKVYGELTSLNAKDTLFNSTYSILEKFQSETKSDGYTYYKYKDNVEIGEIEINDGTITFNL